MLLQLLIVDVAEVVEERCGERANGLVLVREELLAVVCVDIAGGDGLVFNGGEQFAQPFLPGEKHIDNLQANCGR